MKLHFKFKFKNTRKVLNIISSFGKIGLDFSRFISWRGMRNYQEGIYNQYVGKPSIEITTKVGCNNHCDFCPQDNLLNAHKDRLASVNSVGSVSAQETLLNL